MKKLLSLLLATLMLFSLAGCKEDAGDGQLTDKIFYVGVVQLAQHDALDAATQGFKDELEKEFSNIVVDVQNAQGDSSNCTVIANGFVNDGYDLIMANATPALLAASAATATIPVLGTSVTEYGDAFGIENFNGIVGGNVSGTSDLANLQQQADIILDLVDNVKSVGILYCRSEKNSVYQFNVVKEYLEGKGIKVVDGGFTGSEEVQQTTENLCLEVDAIYIPTDNVAANCGDTIDGVCRPLGIPVVTGEENTAIKCGIATQTIDYYELGVITAKMAGQILRGEKDIAEMPIQYYSDYYTETKKYNPTICKDLGIEVTDEYEAIEG